MRAGNEQIHPDRTGINTKTIPFTTHTYSTKTGGDRTNIPQVG